MRSILLTLLLAIPAIPACAQLYAELDSMADQVRATETNFEYSPRITLGFENNDVGTRLRYWHLNTTVDLGAEQPDYSNYRYHFDVLDWDVYKQYSGLRLFGGLRGGFLTFSARSSPASNAPFYVGNYGPTTIPFFHYADDYNGNAILPSYYYPSYSNSSAQTDSIRSAVFGPTAGLEGDVPIIGNLWVDYGARASFLLANWYSTDNYSSTYIELQLPSVLSLLHHLPDNEYLQFNGPLRRHPLRPRNLHRPRAPLDLRPARRQV